MDDNILFAHFAISRKFLTEEQVREGIGELQSTPNSNLPSICLEKKWMTPETATKITQEIQKTLQSQNRGDLENSVHQLKVRVTGAMKIIPKSVKSEILKKVASVQNQDTQVIRKDDIAHLIQDVQDSSTKISSMPKSMAKKLTNLQNISTQKIVASDINKKQLPTSIAPIGIDDACEKIVVRSPTQHMRNFKFQDTEKKLLPTQENTKNKELAPSLDRNFKFQDTEKKKLPENNIPQNDNPKNKKIPSEIIKKVKVLQDLSTQVINLSDIEKAVNSDAFLPTKEKSFSPDKNSSLSFTAPKKEKIKEKIDFPKTQIISQLKKTNRTKIFLTFDNYEIMEEIARGGMGIVYKGRQKETGLIVAIKVMKKFDITNPKYVARFHREIEAAGKLNHPNIVGVYNAGEIESVPYFAMEYVEGLTLSEYAKQKKPSIEKVVSIVKKIALAIHHAHKHHIIHRDLKPANIIIDENGEPHITDFGLAKDMSSMAVDLTQSGIILGTPYYMSPEQSVANKEQVGKGSDIFSIGVMLYELLSEKLPFTADDVSKLYRKISHHRPTKIRKIKKNIPTALEIIVEKALAKKPTRRYKSGKLLADDLGRYEKNQPINAKPPLFWDILVDGAEKHQFLLLGVLFSFLLICAFYVIVIWKV